MKTILAVNVNEAWPLALMYMRNPHAVFSQPSRYGETLEYMDPVATVYSLPMERVLFCPWRDANPFFHLMEALWIVAGRNDVEPLVRYNKRMKEFSDNGHSYHGAYGYRLRHNAGFDQIDVAVEMLRADPDSRRVVLQIWDASIDLNAKSKDIPCNDLIFLKIRQGVLHMRVCCRSNDVIWGCYGANAVQFSVLLEYLAWRIGVTPGTLTQISDSFHVYTSGPGGDAWLRAVNNVQTYPISDKYSMKQVHVFPMFSSGDTDHRFISECHVLLSGTGPGLNSYGVPFIRDVALPMAQAWMAWKTSGAPAGIEILQRNIRLTGPVDWFVAGLEWLQRRHNRIAGGQA